MHPEVSGIQSFLTNILIKKNISTGAYVEETVYVAYNNFPLLLGRRGKRQDLDTDVAHPLFPAAPRDAI